MNGIFSVWLIWMFIIVFVALTKSGKSKTKAGPKPPTEYRNSNPDIQPEEQPQRPNPYLKDGPNMSKLHAGKPNSYPPRPTMQPPVMKRKDMQDAIRNDFVGPQDRPLHGKLSRESREDEKEWFK